MGGDGEDDDLDGDQGNGKKDQLGSADNMGGDLNNTNPPAASNTTSKGAAGGSDLGSKQVVTKGVFFSPRLERSMELIREGRWEDSMFDMPSGDLSVVRKIKEAESLLFASWRANKVVDESLVHSSDTHDRKDFSLVTEPSLLVDNGPTAFDLDEVQGGSATIVVPPPCRG